MHDNLKNNFIQTEEKTLKIKLCCFWKPSKIVELKASLNFKYLDFRSVIFLTNKRNLIQFF